MLAASRVKMSDSERKKKVNKNTSDISSIKRVNLQNNSKEMYQKSVLLCKVAFFLIRPIVGVFFFTALVAFAA